MDILLLRLKAPLMSFGDLDSSEELGPTMRHPGLSMIAGLIANALGHEHGESTLTQEIQDAMRMASLELTRGTIETDEQVASIAKDDTGFTTTGAPMERGGHPYSYRGALRRWKDYISGGEIAVAVAFQSKRINLDEVEQALRRPARPLFIGRRCCLPSAPLVIGRVTADSLVAALATLRAKERPGLTCHARWDAQDQLTESGIHISDLIVADRRDWQSRIHGGERVAHEGMI